MNNSKSMHENEIFRFFECKLSIEKTCKLLDVSQKAVLKWDKGFPIPAYYRQIMRMYAGLDLDQIGWIGWRFQGGDLITPMGFRLTPEMIEYWAIMGIEGLSDKETESRRLRYRKKKA